MTSMSVSTLQPMKSGYVRVCQLLQVNTIGVYRKEKQLRKKKMSGFEENCAAAQTRIVLPPPPFFPPSFS